MIPNTRVLKHTILFAVILISSWVFGGCSKKGNGVTPPEIPVAPKPDTPQRAIALLEWCWDQRNKDTYREVFTADYEFQFAAPDSLPSDSVFNRIQELESAANLFVEGNGTEPPARSISLAFNPFLIVMADSRPGKNPKWHKEIATNYGLQINTDGQDYSLLGLVRFFVTRGDSALIPQELIDLGFAADSTRWYVDHWIDETTCSKPCITFGTLKRIYQ
jgi:hypothetical protein